MKYIITLNIFLFLNNCSLNKDSKYWTEDFIEIKNQEKSSMILERSNDITNMTLKEYEIYIDDYTEISKYPDINQ